MAKNVERKNITLKQQLEEMVAYDPEMMICIGTRHSGGFLWFGTVSQAQNEIEDYISCLNHKMKKDLDISKKDLHVMIQNGERPRKDISPEATDMAYAKRISETYRKIKNLKLAVEAYKPAMKRIVLEVNRKEMDVKYSVIIDGFEENRYWMLSEWDNRIAKKSKKMEAAV